MFNFLKGKKENIPRHAPNCFGMFSNMEKGNNIEVCNKNCTDNMKSLCRTVELELEDDKK